MLSMERPDAWQGASHASERRWYACYTRARHEKQVDRLLKERLIESYLPLVRRTQQWKDRRKQVEFALFPSYTFARFAPDELSRVISIPGIASIVRSNGYPVAIPPEEIANIQLFTASLAGEAFEAELVPLPRAGDRVRITDGPFRGVTGTVVDHRRRLKLLVGISSIGWGIQVEVDASVAEVLSGEPPGIDDTLP
jgi:transcription antitermination factor NusG